jgi:hypothetical protein
VGLVPSLVQALRAGARVVPADTTHGARKSNKYCTAGICVFADTSLEELTPEPRPFRAICAAYFDVSIILTLFFFIVHVDFYYD